MEKSFFLFFAKVMAKRNPTNVSFCVNTNPYAVHFMCRMLGENYIHLTLQQCQKSSMVCDEQLIVLQVKVGLLSRMLGRKSIGNSGSSVLLGEITEISTG